MCFLFKVNAQPKTSQLMQQHIERFRYSWSWQGFTLDNGFVGLRASGDIIRLDGQDFLKDMGCTECLDSPDFHLTETLSTELSLTAQRLLCNQ